MSDPAAPTPAPRRRWPRRLALALLAVLLLTAAAAAWLLGTGAGLRFVLARAGAASSGAFNVQQARGHLAGHFQLTGLRYHDAASGLDVTVTRVDADLDAMALLGLRLHLRRLDLGAVSVTLPAHPAPATGSRGMPSLRAPRPIRLDRLHVGRVRITRGTQTLFASRHLDLAARWHGDHLVLSGLNLDADAGQVQLQADLRLAAPWHGSLHGRFDWRLHGQRYAGRLDGHDAGSRATLALQLRRPLALQLQIALQPRTPYLWTARLKAPAFDPSPWLGPGRLRSVTLALTARGDREHAQLEGDIDLDGHRLQLQPLQLHRADHGDVLVLDTLRLRSPTVPGQLQASGRLQLAPQPLAGSLALQWQGVQLPADLIGQALVTTGTLQAGGSTANYHASADFSLGPPGKPATVKLALDGNARALRLRTLDVHHAGGSLRAQGEVGLGAATTWQLQATASHFDPGEFAAAWPGHLDASLSSRGRLQAGRPQATLDIQRLHGDLRGHALAGHGRLHLDAGVLSGQLQLHSGHDRLLVDGHAGRRNAVRAQLHVTSLAAWVPKAAGGLDADVHASGLWPGLAVRAHLDASAIRVAGQQVRRLSLRADLPDLRRPSGQLSVNAEGVEAGGLTFSQLHLAAAGTAAAHHLTLNARGKPLGLAVKLDGGRNSHGWHGILRTLTLAPDGAHAWQLSAPATLSWQHGAAQLGQTCLQAGAPRLCLSAQRHADGSARLQYRLQQVPLALFAALAGGQPPVRGEGLLDGSGSLQRSPTGQLHGDATLRSAQGRLFYEGAAQPLLAYRSLDLRAHLAGRGGRLSLHAGLDHGGSLAGDVQVNGPQQALAGHVELHLRSLAFVELLSHAVAHVTGQADASVTLGGRLAQPSLGGQLTLAGFGAEIPAAGLKLADGTLTLDTTDARHFRIDGLVQSGHGTIKLDGVAGLGHGDAIDLQLAGSDVTVADLPAAQVAVSPLLQIKRRDDGLHVTGNVALDRAHIDLSKLPGAGAAKPSPDVVVVDAPKPPPSSPPLPIYSDVHVDLGDHTHLIGFGLDGSLGGRLRIREAPGKATTAQGQIAVNGTYRAYGQDLKIEQGRLLFASTPIDNPGLDIRAVRQLNPTATIDQGQVVGLQVGGTAEHPVLTVFSKPVMAQSDALSYLITGKPLSQVKGGEGNMVGTAAQALGSAAGDLLAKSVGSKLGIDDIGVSNNEALGGTSAFTVGKYLSPRLYLSYGVGLFEPGQVITLRYRLSHRWSVEAQNATSYSRASINYRYEKH